MRKVKKKTFFENDLEKVREMTLGIREKEKCLGSDA